MPAAPPRRRFVPDEEKRAYEEQLRLHRQACARAQADQTWAAVVTLIGVATTGYAVGALLWGLSLAKP
jgi:hypothetical protein